MFGERQVPAPRRAARYVELSTGVAIRAALESAELSLLPSLVIGPSGIGKSAAIAELLEQDVALGATVTAASNKIAGIYRLLLEVYDRPEPARGTIHELERRVYGEIPAVNHGWVAPLILDEYQGIEPLALRELLKVQETVRFPLVLVGNGETIAQRRRPEQQLAMDQIRNQFKFQKRLDGLLAGDFELLADEWMIEREPVTRLAIAAYGRRFSLHQLVMLLAAARELAAIGPTRMEHLQAAIELDNPDRATIFRPAKITRLNDARKGA